MITDPELGEEWKTEPLEHTQARTPSAGERDRPAPRPLWWALGGAVVASAVWAGGLYALEGPSAEPEISYRASKNLCEDFRAQALGAITGDMKRPVNHESDHPAVHSARCVLENAGKDGVATDFVVDVRVDLHKKTDPSAEFEVPPARNIAYAGAGRTTGVPDLGERAVMTVLPGETWLVLKALDGGAVFTVEVAAGTFEENKGRPATDADAVQAAMIEDMRELMAALRKS
ncbi:hypothetical protein ACIQZO_15750 [Streptomyces sp. NPDC097617]|uniref:hypothetical protein n=1 Tax=Streptomyces sp. NPDC097617 TaxID=3366091 RepID=UPI003809DFF0